MTKKYLKGFVTTEKGTGRFSVLASTGVVDRQGESIDPAGWDVVNFLKNPVMLFAHNYDELPVGVAENVTIDSEGLKMDGRFASPEANPKAENVRLLYEDGILSAVSVGFIPKERNGNVITKAELLEVSFVPVPANPQALALAMTKGLPTDGLVVPEYKEPEEKGALAEAMTAEEKFDAKCEKMDSLYELFMAFADVYMAEEAPVEMFAALCEELSGLVAALPEKVDAEAKGAILEKVKSRRDAGVKAQVIRAKEGRVLSSKNEGKIKSAVSVLQEVLADLPAPEGGGKELPAEVPAAKRSGDNEGVIEIRAELLAELLRPMRQADKLNELAIATIKRVLKDTSNS